MQKRYLIEAYDLRVENPEWLTIDEVNYSEEAYDAFLTHRVPFEVFVRVYDAFGDTYLDW